LALGSTICSRHTHTTKMLLTSEWIWKVWWSNLNVRVCSNCRIPNKSICCPKNSYHNSWFHLTLWLNCKPSKRRFPTMRSKEGNFLWDEFGTLFIKNKYDSLDTWAPTDFISCWCVNIICKVKTCICDREIKWFGRKAI